LAESSNQPLSLVKLDERLSQDSVHVAFVADIEIRLMNVAAFFWVLIIPRGMKAEELHELDEHTYTKIMTLVRHLSRGLKNMTSAYKVNVATLGNQVRQLHIHIILRHEQDPAWPKPVWGHHETTLPNQDETNRRMAYVNEALASIEP